LGRLPALAGRAWRKGEDGWPRTDVVRFGKFCRFAPGPRGTILRDTLDMAEGRTLREVDEVWGFGPDPKNVGTPGTTGPVLKNRESLRSLTEKSILDIGKGMG